MGCVTAKQEEIMKAAINVWTWGITTKQQFEQGVKEVADVGFRAVENISSIAALYEQDPGELGRMLGNYCVELVCAYHHLSGDFAADYANAGRYLKFLQGWGVKLMNLQAGRRVEGGPDEKVLAETVEQARQICALAQKHGVTVCLHPHYATNVERQHELDYVMDRLEPSVLSLTIDTAHCVLGGMDPVAVAAQYGSRVGYVHAKDIQPVSAEGAPWWGKFRELGRGVINFVAFAAELGKAGFDGFLCVELDSPRVSGYKSAAISRQFLRDELGI
jgi:sugar phosphate isomerase/epimerase